MEYKYYIFPENKFVHSCAQLLENIIRKKQQLLLYVEAADYWDEALWLNPKDGFLPHAKYEAEEGWDLAPVIITEIMPKDLPYSVIVSINSFQATTAETNVFIADKVHAQEMQKLYRKYPGSLWPEGGLNGG